MRRPIQTRKKIAVIQKIMVIGGGSEACTVQAIEALSIEYDVTLITFSEVDTESLNEAYGASINPHTLKIITPPIPRWLKNGSRLSLLKGHLIMRYIKSVNDQYDLLISVGEPMDFGRPSIQYVVLAADSTLAQVMSSRSTASLWYKAAKRAFSWLCQRISHYSLDKVAANRTLVESTFTGDLLTDMYGINDSTVVFPPVNIPIRNRPWCERQNGFLCISRITPGKLVHQVFDILNIVRSQGYEISLRIVGRTDDSSYMKQIQDLCQDNSSWASTEGFVTRSELESFKQSHKFGINAASDEPFGIGVAEMVASGLIVFVSNGGGQTEIVGTPELIFDDVNDAAAKIISVLQSKDVQESLLANLKQNVERFSTQTFRTEIKEAAKDFLEEQRNQSQQVQTAGSPNI